MRGIRSAKVPITATRWRVPRTENEDPLLFSSFSEFCCLSFIFMLFLGFSFWLVSRLEIACMRRSFFAKSWSISFIEEISLSRFDSTRFWEMTLFTRSEMMEPFASATPLRIRTVTSRRTTSAVNEWPTDMLRLRSIEESSMEGLYFSLGDKLIIWSEGWTEGGNTSRRWGVSEVIALSDLFCRLKGRARESVATVTNTLGRRHHSEENPRCQKHSSWKVSVYYGNRSRPNVETQNEFLLGTTVAVIGNESANSRGTPIQGPDIVQLAGLDRAF